tara:strand:+ start:1742 stop:2392 length:651 start_codon:yes stop_codon:yes gene_type:complete
MKNYLSDFTSLLSQIVVNMFLRSFSPKNGRFIWFDIETTGFNQFHSEIIEIAAVDNLGNTFNELINIGHKKLPKKIKEITHITDDMLVGKPGIKTVLKRFLDFLNIESTKTRYLIGHNSFNFDLPFIKCKFRQNRLKFPSNIREMDTLKMAQLLMPQEWSHSLGHLCNLFGINNTNAHRALSDVYATQILYQHLCIIFKSKYKKFTPIAIINRITF